MHFSLEAWIHQFGYIGVFFILFFEMVGIPFPAETTLTLSGIEWMRGGFSLVPLLLAAGLGNIAGSTVAYAIGRFVGRPVIVRYGRFVGLTNERLDKANETFEKYRTSVILFAKFIAGIRVVIPYLAGINKMSFGLFTIYNAVSAIVWAGCFIIVGKYIEVAWSQYKQTLHTYLVPLVLVAVVVVATMMGLRVWRKRKKC